MDIRLQRATSADIDTLEPLVAAYHEFESLDSSALLRRRALSALVDDERLGCVHLIVADGATAGYIALCYGYSIEFAGCDAFVDEFYLEPAYRGQGIGRIALAEAATIAQALDIRALHLEVARENSRAARLYRACGFEARDKYHLMTRYLS